MLFEPKRLRKEIKIRASLKHRTRWDSQSYKNPKIKTRKFSQRIALFAFINIGLKSFGRGVILTLQRHQERMTAGFNYDAYLEPPTSILVLICR